MRDVFILSNLWYYVSHKQLRKKELAMTAEQSLNSSHEINEYPNAQIINELAHRAVPPVVEWGPAHNRDDKPVVELETPAGLSYSA